MNPPFDDAAVVAREAVARAAAPPDKRPLARDLPPAPAFPAEALGPLRGAAEALHELVRVPFSIAAQSTLAAATLVVQQHRDIELPNAGRKPLTGFFATVAESGERKSSCDRVALRAVNKFEQDQAQQYRPAYAAYLADRDAWRAATEAAKKKGKGDRIAIREALVSIGAEPRPPQHHMLLVADPTLEALINHLAGRSWAGLFTDEAGVFVGGHSMNDEHKTSTAAHLNKLWDGADIRRVRVGTGLQHLPGRRCSLHLMMQPIIAAKFYGDAILSGSGTLARVLTVAPETAAGTRFFREAPDDPALAIHDAHMAALLRRPPRLAPGEPEALDPPALELEHRARALWIAFHDQAEHAIKPGGDWAPIRGFGSKAAEHAGRLAAVLATYADPDTMAVSARHMACGIELAQHYAAEALRLGEAGQVAPDVRLAERLLAWWAARGQPRCHLAAIYQRGLNAIGDAATARRIVTILEEHGHIRRLEPGTILDGAARRDCWELVQ